jgi:integrase
LSGGLRREIAYRVEREDVELFKAKLAAEGVTRDTASYYVRYLVKFLDDVGWVLWPETLQRVYAIEQPRIMGKTAVALKRFIDTIVKVKEPQLAPLLYDAFKTVQSWPKNGFRIPTLEEVRRVWEEAHKILPCAAAVWGITAETGVRLDHLRKSSLGGLQLYKRRLLLGEVNGPKRQPLVFLTEGAVKHLHETYHPWRERFEHMLGQQTNRLFPCEELTIYRLLKEARERAGLPWLEPRLLRKFNAQWLLDSGADAADIDLPLGRSVRERVLFELYIADY